MANCADVFIVMTTIIDAHHCKILGYSKNNLTHAIVRMERAKQLYYYGIKNICFTHMALHTRY
jgi:hypothetical protein